MAHVSGDTDGEAKKHLDEAPQSMTVQVLVQLSSAPARPSRGVNQSALLLLSMPRLRASTLKVVTYAQSYMRPVP